MPKLPRCKTCGTRLKTTYIRVMKERNSVKKRIGAYCSTCHRFMDDHPELVNGDGDSHHVVQKFAMALERNDEVEARVYAAMLTRGSTDVDEIATVLDLDHAVVRDVLDRFNGDGLVQKWKGYWRVNARV
ncbi:hypothetical protein GF325_13405 [Candidatus Bathyarchaeota archaeon]|nr:hypothetical protein [Candidatus Bathyarchaeota archaeon]